MGNVHPYFSWQGKDHTPPTTAEMIASCLENTREAAHLASIALRDYRAAVEGSAACAKAAADYDRYCSDQAHWRDMAAYYRLEQARELDELRAADAARARIAAAAVARLTSRAPVPVVDRGADAWEEERETAWQDIGGAPAGGR